MSGEVYLKQHHASLLFPQTAGKMSLGQTRASYSSELFPKYYKVHASLENFTLISLICQNILVLTFQDLERHITLNFREKNIKTCINTHMHC